MANFIPEWDVAFSFAGEQRTYVRIVADRLRAMDVRVFYDSDQQVDLWGKDLFEYLDHVYRVASRYCVVFISADYARKRWTNHERKSAQARAFSTNGEYILPARFDDTELPGFLPTTGYVDLRTLEPNRLADLIASKVGKDPLPPRPVAYGDSGSPTSRLILPSIEEATKLSLSQKVEDFMKSVGDSEVQSPAHFARLNDVSTMGERDLRRSLRGWSSDWNAIGDALTQVSSLRERLGQLALRPQRSWLVRRRTPDLGAAEMSKRAESILLRADALTVLSVATKMEAEELWSRLLRLQEYSFLARELHDTLMRGDSPLLGEIAAAADQRTKEFDSTLESLSRKYLSLQEATRSARGASIALAGMGKSLQRAAHTANPEGRRLDEWAGASLVAVSAELRSLDGLREEIEEWSIREGE